MGYGHRRILRRCEWEQLAGWKLRPKRMACLWNVPVCIGKEGTLPRLFDMVNPVCADGNGDPDLGAPNQACPGGGPGEGVGGEPGQPGENCDPLRFGLIVQEPGIACPDDNVDGGSVTLDFVNPGGQFIFEIGILDVDYATDLEIEYYTYSSGVQTRTISVPLLGDNSYQVVEINQPNTKSIKLNLERSASITSIKFCRGGGVPPPTNPPPTNPAPTAPRPSLRPPSAAPPTPPVVSPTTGPAPTSVPGGCTLKTVGFDYDSDGKAVTKGTYVKDEWIGDGMTVLAEGGEGMLPRIFDTANPVCADGDGDSDLGAPNKAYPGGVAGHGEGGEPGKPGENCSPKGNALIVQEPGTSCPDDNVDGGIILSTFHSLMVSMSRRLVCWTFTMEQPLLSCTRLRLALKNSPNPSRFSVTILLRQSKSTKPM